MKPIIFFLMLSFSVLGQEQLEYVLWYELEKQDTLFIHSDRENVQYHFLWKGDTLLSEWTYEYLPNAFTPIGTMGFFNSFLVSGHAGDGCPILYRIIALKGDGTWFVSEQFGNCEAFSTIKIKAYPRMEFTFAASPMAKRKKAKIVYDGVIFKIY